MQLTMFSHGLLCHGWLGMEFLSQEILNIESVWGVGTTTS